MSRRLTVGPFNRVEGDLEVQLEVADGRVADAWVTASLYRGFEQILVDREPEEALVIAPRICGICSVSQSAAAAAALSDLAGHAPTANGRLALNLIKATENLADHLTHFHLFFMPDLARQDYAKHAWQPRAAARYRAIKGEAVVKMLAARSRLLNVMGILAGKWPHSLAIRPGGTTKSIDIGDRMRLISIIGETRRYLETEIFGSPLEAVSTCTSESDLEPRVDGPGLPFFLHVAAETGFGSLGPAPQRFMSYGAYGEEAEGGFAFAPGLWDNGAVGPLDASRISEDPAHARLRGTPCPPAEAVTEPEPDKPGAYSWCKAPRLDGRTVEVGALARQLIDGQPLIRRTVEAQGGSVYARVLARLIESARLLLLMERWVEQLALRAPFCVDDDLPDDGDGVGLVEAARGGLGHWVSVRNGKISRYQIIAPTTWNFSPRDSAGNRGPLEEALIGTRLDDRPESSVRIQHVVRSYDPCMVCTVH